MTKLDIEQLSFKAVFDAEVKRGVSPFKIAFDLLLEAKAARNDALEEAARACEMLGDKGWDADVTGMCAMAIYQLKRQ